MTCDTVRDRLPELAMGLLGREARAEVESHLAGCPECRDELAFVRDVRDAAPAPPAGSLEAVREALAEVGQEGAEPAHDTPVLRLEPRSDPARAQRAREWRWSLPAAAVLVVALGSVQVWRSLAGPETVPDGPGIELAVVEDPGVGFFAGDDGLIAGGAVLEELPDDALRSILDELEQWEG